MTVRSKAANLATDSYVNAASNSVTGEIMAFKKGRQQGMTLLELMIVVAIVGILAAIALPSFNNSVMKARRADARNSLFDWQLRQAEYFANNASYASMSTLSSSDAEKGDSGEGYYEITVMSFSTTTFQMKAEPKSGTTQANDSDCDDYFCINQDGPLYTSDCAPKTCW